ncbi:MAG TPA: HD domain-containing phosphohydrolase, partial [Ktedonobacterales bacterium]|nr:HD domain-containing phosphohydrolase [Ktedonobacterales bacterium]
GMIEALTSLVDARDHATGRHTEEIRQLMQDVALAMGCEIEDARLIGMAGSLRDVGKVAIPDSILCKPAPLTSDEWEIIQTHAIVGAEVVERIPSLCPLVPIIRSHHERWDGSGYPDRLAGQAIPLGGRIAAVVDAFVAMTERRPYRPALSHAEAFAELSKCAGTQFDPDVVIAFTQVVGDRAPHAEAGISTEMLKLAVAA